MLGKHPVPSHLCWEAAAVSSSYIKQAAAERQRTQLQEETSGDGSCALRAYTMRVFALLWTVGFLLKEAQAWGFKNGIFHNSIWLGKKCFLVVEIALSRKWFTSFPLLSIKTRLKGALFPLLYFCFNAINRIN